jgi:hypothetical protein
VWLCYGNLRDVVVLWVFKGCGYVMDILEVWLYYGYLKGVVMSLNTHNTTTSLKYP